MSGQPDAAAARLQEYIARVVAEAPPLDPARADRIAALLRSSEERSAAA
ncbi:hypothetical protein [Sinomonas sp. P10A9]|uniref:Anti-sigma factor n=1 Tax=Sinomonas puerhi TaxID=3238584 RepID=A0AB39KZS7_9MICC